MKGFFTTKQKYIFVWKMDDAGQGGDEFGQMFKGKCVNVGNFGCPQFIYITPAEQDSVRCLLKHGYVQYEFSDFMDELARVTGLLKFISKKGRVS